MEDKHKNQLSDEEQDWLNALIEGKPIPEEPVFSKEASAPEDAAPEEETPFWEAFDPFENIPVLGESTTNKESPAPDPFVSYEEASTPKPYMSYEESPISEEIGPDEDAVYQAGLTHPQDSDLEKILAEDWASIMDETSVLPEEDEEAPAPEFPHSDMYPESDNTEDAPRKGRPKATNFLSQLGIPHILATIVWIALIVAIGVSLGRLAWVCCSDIMAFGKASQEVTVTITEQDDISSISKKLGKAGLVRYPGLFEFFAEITGKDENISVGTFTLNSHLDYNAMINAMVDYGATRKEVDVMFPEGANCAQIFALLEENEVCSVADMEAFAANGELGDYWFLEGVPRGDKYCLEGYLAPDTYTFYTDDEPGRVLVKFLDEFESRFTDKMKENFTALQERYTGMMAQNGYDSSYIQANPLTLHQVITLASMVSRETASDAESYQIASVFYNRLTNPMYPYLDSDATVYYAIGDYFHEIDELTEEHLNTDSPYNTRNHEGLPPGPICNPGVYSLYAALDPDETDYYFFLYDHNTYSHIFSNNYMEHMSHLYELELE